MHEESIQEDTTKTIREDEKLTDEQLNDLKLVIRTFKSFKILIFDLDRN